MLSFLQTFSSSFWSVNCRVGSFSGWNWQKPEESKKRRRRRGLFFPTFLRLLWPLVVEPSRRESDLKLNTDRAALCYGNNLETQHRSKNCRFFCGRVHVGAHTHTHTHHMLLSFVQISIDFPMFNSEFQLRCWPGHLFLFQFFFSSLFWEPSLSQSDACTANVITCCFQVPRRA